MEIADKKGIDGWKSVVLRFSIQQGMRLKRRKRMLREKLLSDVH